MIGSTTTDWARCVYLERVRRELQVHHDILNKWAAWVAPYM